VKLDDLGGSSYEPNLTREYPNGSLELAAMLGNFHTVDTMKQLATSINIPNSASGDSESPGSSKPSEQAIPDTLMSSPEAQEIAQEIAQESPPSILDMEQVSTVCYTNRESRGTLGRV